MKTIDLVHYNGPAISEDMKKLKVRRTWGNFRPVTRIKSSIKLYKRKKVKFDNSADYSEG